MPVPLEKNEIIFLDTWKGGKVPRSQRQYADFFDQLKKIKKVRFRSYPPDKHHDRIGATERKLFVRKIQEQAAQCRRERDTESGWVNNVANLVLGRLTDSEFHWHLWKPDFLALPAHADEKVVVQNEHDEPLCKCGVLVRAEAKWNRTQLRHIFSNKSSETIIDRDPRHDSSAAKKKGSKPDRVFGLSRTTTFKLSFQETDNLSPFKEGSTIYPFLVVEAKAEKSNSGWHDIEQQSKTPLRICLRDQVELSLRGEKSLLPIVWFLAFEGDWWRLYFVLPAGDGGEAICCWNGGIENADDTLQLLLIIDWICGWAKNVYRPAVLGCLEQLRARERTPVESSQDSSCGSAVTAFESLDDSSGDPPIDTEN